MRLGNVRPHGRFVFDDRGGVWKRTAWTRARCIYGKEYGTEIDVDPNVPVYVIFDSPVNKFQRNSSERDGRMESRCPKCGGSLIGKPAGCPTCHTILPEASTSSENAKVIPVVQERKIMKGSSGEGIVVEKGSGEPVTVPPGIRIVLIDDDERKLLEWENCSAEAVAAFTSSGYVRIKLPDKGIVEMNIHETLFDVNSNALFIILRE